MKHLVFALASLLAMAPAAAGAAWSGAKPLGAATTATSNPSCAQVALAEVVCAVRNQNGKLAVNRYVNNAWTGWTALAASISSDPSCTERGTREVICAARNNGNTLVYSRFNGTGWSAPATVGGSKLYSAPSCARASATRLVCVGRAAGGGLIAATYTNTTWSSLATIATSTIQSFTPPSCASDTTGGVVCVTLNHVSNVVAIRYDGAAWQGLLNIGGIATDSPTCSTLKLTGTGQVVCMARGLDFGAYPFRYRPSAWNTGAWSWDPSPGGAIRTRFQCASLPGVMVCTTIGAGASGPYAYSTNGNSTNGWTGWVTVVLVPNINETACAPYDNSTVLCVFTGFTNQLFSRTGA